MTATTTTDYRDFLIDKLTFAAFYGHTVDIDEINPCLFPHQKAIVQWAVKGGRRAIFARFGLGKSIMQLETLRLTLAASGGRGLIVCPLGVRQEFVNDARTKLGFDITFVRRNDDVKDSNGIYITNYESVRDGKLDPNLFMAVSLDEASVLRSYGSKTYQEFLTLFHDVPYRFVATATPSPNRYKELIHYAGYLGIMDTGQALTRWFKRDSTQANNLTLFAHKADEFWMWLATWAAFVQQPSDLGFSDDGYSLPPMQVHRHEVNVDHTGGGSIDPDGQVHLYRGGDMSMVEASREKRHTMPLRIADMMRIIDAYREAGDLDQIVLWCDLNDEQAAIEKALTAAGITWSSIHGSLDVDEAERRMAEWRNCETVALIGKPVMLGQGVNLQQCNKAVFVGITYKFNDLIQATHRLQRFGQQRTVQTHIIHADSERHVWTTLMTKWDQHKELTETMSNLIQEHGLNALTIDEALKRSIGVERVEASGPGWMHVLNDTVAEGELLESDSIDMMLTSIPFANQYEYTAAAEDFGHSDTPEHFWRQMDYLTPNLLRALRPGRVFAVHVKDRILFGNQYGTGSPTVSPLHAQAIDHYRRHGFDYFGMITVVTDVVRENNQTYRLTYGEMVKDGTRMGVGMPEYVILLRKPQTDRSRGYADVPVVHDRGEYTLARWQQDAAAFWRSNGDRAITPDEFAQLTTKQQIHLFTVHSLSNLYDWEAHVKIGEHLLEQNRLPKTFGLLSPGSHHQDVWHDINRMDTANTAQAQGGREMHVCPMQHDIVDRLIERFTMRDELVYDPFGGLATTVYRAVKAGRRGRAVELNPGYWADGVRYCQIEERKASMPTLFDLDGNIDTDDGDEAL
jgi:DNA modification methylase